MTGGNKIRKLEYILADAKEKGADTIVTTGGLQSNHTKITAAFAIKLGFKPILLLNGREPEVKKANLFINDLLGVEVRYIQVGNQKEMNQALDMVARKLKEEGKRPYVIPVGGSKGLGSLGYIDAYHELESQRRKMNLNFDWEFITTGSGGTFAGIYMGHLIHGSESKLVGVSPWLPAGEIRDQIIDCINEGAKYMDHSFLRYSSKVDPLTIHIDDQFIGEGYGKPTRAGMHALKLIAFTEGILLDHVYTAKTMACLLHYVETGIIEKKSKYYFGILVPQQGCLL
ncbi:pyridoxal-phosphate dependent enzyme [Fodinisporobacter ferrooxydans]|uniref:Pyridoxal-phosphate dependent enzyme n=1 Tax=Fodinisporobacter ferrooxydans TaxID=2901836 RepID=A0ABY4CPC9_9BACL|nr:pyridoxal-phosphate dependent enzyme [Alicyclobacillaceae bacterium MYW30-H2]